MQVRGSNTTTKTRSTDYLRSRLPRVWVHCRNNDSGVERLATSPLAANRLILEHFQVYSAVPA